MADTSVKQKIIDKLKDSSNILVTVNSNPSVDELSAALGITLLLNKMNKHATAVFSGAIPPAIEFLQPEKTFENTVDSLRDFIIALDKEKADHLRYKVVEDMVKIFITPYRTTISEKDLDFSQGDYNVEAVLAIGVQNEDDLDKALASHGRILHDATVAAISLGEPTSLGGIEWADKNASSYSELLVSLADGLKLNKSLIDEQIATAFLTGIVAATERFSNDKTSANVMTISAQLMAAGANQQLIAIKLNEDTPQAVETVASQDDNGDLKDGETAKLNRADTPVPTEKTAEPGEVMPPLDTPAPDGSLAISHMPEGDLDEVSRQVAEEKSAQAEARAVEELSKHIETPREQQASAPVLTSRNPEDELADSLANAMPTAQSAQIPNLQGAISTDKWQTAAVRQENQDFEPTMGGTLNATTEQAAIEKRRQIEDDRNRTILTHGGSSYVTGEPTYQSPINAVNQANPEPVVTDVLSQSLGSEPTGRAAAIQPPESVLPAPTLAEIDEQNRNHHDDALVEVNAAFGGSGIPSFNEPVPDAQPNQPAISSLPPMPDFSTLPPLPGEPINPSHDTLGDLLPPISQNPSQAAQPARPNDPGQFRIPGQ